MKIDLTRIQLFATDLFERLRHPTRRGVALSLAAIPLLVLLYALLLIPFTPSIGAISKAKAERPTVVMSSDGKELTLFGRSNRDRVTLSEISPHVVAALVATEDHRFYEHHGIDFRRTASAVLHTFTGDRQGGSTITQQLARNLYTEQVGRAQTVTRKIKELITALKIEAVYSKDEILETYLNTVPFLYNAYGIEMAARTYFDKPAAKLDVLESATLIGMLKGTSYYNPVLNPERSRERRNVVLGQMVKNNKLDVAKLEELKKRPLKVNFERQTEQLGLAPHFSEQLRRWLIEWADRHDYNIYADGLVVYTTINTRLQALANQAVARQGERLQKVASSQWAARTWRSKKTLERDFVRETPEYKAARDAGDSDDEALKKLLADVAFMTELHQDKTRLQAGLIAQDPRNGHVLAWVGSRDFVSDPFDHVAQARRQPGSTFKPFVYGAAFEQGAQTDDSFVDQAVEIRLANGDVWRPSDGEPPSGLPMTLREGLVNSKNTITAQLMQTVGAARVAGLAQALGVRESKLEQVPSLALGTSPVTLKEMVSAYSSITNNGSYIEPVTVLRIEDKNGVLLEEFAPKAPEQAMSVAAAQTLLDVMRGVVDSGTGAGIRSEYGIQADVAGKTGTTQDNTDGWFILMHQQLVAGAWVGFNDNRVTMLSNYWGQGAHNALPIVGDFFRQSLRTSLVDQNAQFAAPRRTEEVIPALQPLMNQINDWFNGLFSRGAPPPPVQAPYPQPEVGRVWPGSPPAYPRQQQPDVGQILPRRGDSAEPPLQPQQQPERRQVAPRSFGDLWFPEKGRGGK